jgi:hypothetical protein
MRLLRLSSPLAILSLPLLLAARPAAAQLGSTPQAIDFGEQGHYANPSAELVLENQGPQPVRIEKIHPTCSCITVTPPSLALPIPPGGSARLSVSMNGGRAMGTLRKHVEVTPAGARAPALRVPVSMRVFDGYNMEPREGYHFAGVVGGEPVSMTVRLSPRGEGKRAGPMDLKDPEVMVRRGANTVSSPDLKAEVVDVAGGRGIKVTLLPTHPEGRVFSELHAVLDGKKLVIPIAGDMFRGIKVEPTYLNFNRVSPDDPSTFVEKNVLTSTDGRPFRIVSLSALFTQRPSEDLRLALGSESESGGARHTVWAALAPGRTLRDIPDSGRLSGKVIIATDHPEKPELTVTFFGFFAKPGG